MRIYDQSHLPIDSVRTILCCHSKLRGTFPNNALQATSHMHLAFQTLHIQTIINWLTFREIPLINLLGYQSTVNEKKREYVRRVKYEYTRGLYLVNGWCRSGLARKVATLIPHTSLS